MRGASTAASQRRTKERVARDEVICYSSISSARAQRQFRLVDCRLERMKITVAVNPSAVAAESRQRVIEMSSRRRDGAIERRSRVAC